MNSKQSSITILCPVFNEAENVARFVSEFTNVIQPLKQRYSFEFLFVDNCSTDGTLDCLLLLQKQYPNISIIKYSRNFGVMKSIFTGIVNSNSSACAVFDCDLQDPPELLIEFIKQWASGAKVVYGVRRKRDEGFVIGFLRNIYREIERYIKGYAVTIESGAWFLDERVIRELRMIPFEPYLAGLIARLGFKTAGVPYDRRARLLGQSKFGLMKYFSYAADGLVSGTIVPLRISVFCGIVFSLLSFVLGTYFVVAKLFLGIPFPEGVAAAIVILLFGFGLNFLLLGVVGEYLGRIYMQKESSQTAIIEESYPGSKNSHGLN
ncbi:MAG: glycosyltransferase family 2 protein [Methylobacter sp.]|uniref:glycosyltransferase family 2 protein n=1 Tax=Methylobacter sp. TaxID=2051955 RepID=UPI00272EEC10|nr:glycosyltransferase family 2 protein [Methylobacter sp.]MDP1665887.1 glycosyltransferase family 2 protein [Methylobacter sp.]